ncbi:MAG: hypothetical protein KKA81_12855 [Bacteroidetes bacterium]|nr:hypothetical protein [Bacteroidota bacterium]
MKNFIFFFRRHSFIILIILVLTPLFFINILKTHDWGGDFAMYIMQGQNIMEGKSMSETPYIYNPDNPVLGPPAYPVGFPILLSPVLAIWGADIHMLTLYITFFLFLFAVLSALFLRQAFPGLIVFFMVLVMAYNPWMLSFRTEIMSDLPFATLLLGLSLLVFRQENPSWKRIIIVGLLGGFLISIRVAGWVFPMAFALWSLVLVLRNRKNPVFRTIPCLAKAFAVAGLSWVTYFFLNRVIFPIPLVQGAAYTGIWSAEPMGITILENITYYIGVLEHFFNPENGRWQFLSLLLRSFVVVFALLGLVNRIARRTGFVELLVLCYLGVIMVYPYRHSGFRFLLPLLPFILYYFLEGIHDFRLAIRLNYRYRMLAGGMILVVVFFSGTEKAVLRNDYVMPGPQEYDSEECWQYIRQNIPQNSVIVFFKPRVLSLYTGRKSLANAKNQDADSMKARFEENDAEYILIHQAYSDPAIRNYMGRFEQEYFLQWSNQGFLLYVKNR